jgi:nucleotide-binding universal stress UspA family protein
MYRTILVPLDGSRRAETILPHVATLASCFQAQIILLQVIEPVPIMAGPTMVYTTPSYIDDVTRRDVESYLVGKQVSLRNQGITCVTCLEHGQVVDQIINVARRENVDLIAMASHGRTGLSQMFYGSVANGVLHRIDRPLLLVRAEDD